MDRPSPHGRMMTTEWSFPRLNVPSAPAAKSRQWTKWALIALAVLTIVHPPTRSCDLWMVLTEDGTCANDFLFGVDCNGCNDVDDGIIITDMCRAGSYRECYFIVFVGRFLYDFESMEKGYVWSLWSTLGS